MVGLKQRFSKYHFEQQIGVSQYFIDDGSLFLTGSKKVNRNAQVNRNLAGGPYVPLLSLKHLSIIITTTIKMLYNFATVFFKLSSMEFLAMTPTRP